jgi:hypothetical protein
MGKLRAALSLAALSGAALSGAVATTAAAAPVAATVAASAVTRVQIRPALAPTAPPNTTMARQAVIGTMAEVLKPGAETVLGGVAVIDPGALPLGLARVTTGNTRLTAGAGVGTQGMRSTLSFKSRCASLLPTELSTRVRLGSIISTRAQAEWQSCPGRDGAARDWSWGIGSSVAAGPARILPGAGATASLTRLLDVGSLRTQLAVRPNGDKAAELSLQLKRFLPLQLGFSSGESAGRLTHTLSARMGVRF